MKKSDGTLVIQASPGIGDMIWHLPHLRAIARESKDNQITLLTKSRSLTKKWLHHDPMIKDILYVERQGLLKSLKEISKRNFESVWVLHRSFSYALLAFLSRIPQRKGFGYGAQKFLLTSKNVLDLPLKNEHTIIQINKLLEQEGLSLRAEDQKLPLSIQEVEYINSLYKSYPRPWFCFGVGASDAIKCWPREYFAELGMMLKKRSGGTIFVCGSKSETAVVDWIAEEIREGDHHALGVSHLEIDQCFALLSKIDLFIGNDSSLLNAAACLGLPAVGLFGPTPVLDYLDNIYPITASGSLPPAELMSSIHPQAVFEFLDSKGLLKFEKEKYATACHSR
jgi:heptosyltransferase-2